jgi:hypothetical protein
MICTTMFQIIRTMANLLFEFSVHHMQGLCKFVFRYPSSIHPPDPHRDMASWLSDNRGSWSKSDSFANLCIHTAGEFEGEVLDQNRERCLHPSQHWARREREAKTDLELSECEAFAQARPWSIGEGQKMTVSLELLCTSPDTLAIVEPPFGFKLVCIFTPE